MHDGFLKYIKKEDLEGQTDFLLEIMTQAENYPHKIPGGFWKEYYYWMLISTGLTPWMEGLS